MAITKKTTVEELSAVVSQALEHAGIDATLSGGAAVTIYTENEYLSMDLDFVTSAGRKALTAALSPLGFRLARDQRHFVHDNTDYFLEFPPAPLEFGNKLVQHEDVPTIDTQWGPLRIITPTLCVMDRLCAWWHWHDRQSWDQAVMVARHQQVDFRELAGFAKEEGADAADIRRLQEQAGNREG